MAPTLNAARIWRKLYPGKPRPDMRGRPTKPAVKLPVVTIQNRKDEQ